ncbi:MAG: nitrogenase-stabilizing/protective protein NifW [Pseudomonadota bacterium]
MKQCGFVDELEDLVSAEDFFDYFGIPYDEVVVRVNRLHILQRFHNYLAAARMPSDDAGQKAIYINALTQAYRDFVNSDAATEKVLKVYQRQSGTSFVNFNDIGR